MYLPSLRWIKQTNKQGKQYLFWSFYSHLLFWQSNPSKLNEFLHLPQFPTYRWCSFSAFTRFSLCMQQWQNSPLNLKFTIVLTIKHLSGSSSPNFFSEKAETDLTRTTADCQMPCQVAIEMRLGKTLVFNLLLSRWMPLMNLLETISQLNLNMRFCQNSSFYSSFLKSTNISCYCSLIVLIFGKTIFRQMFSTELGKIIHYCSYSTYFEFGFSLQNTRYMVSSCLFHLDLEGNLMQILSSSVLNWKQVYFLDRQEYIFFIEFTCKFSKMPRTTNSASQMQAFRSACLSFWILQKSKVPSLIGSFIVWSLQQYIIVLSWHYIRVSSSFRSSTRFRMSLNPTSMFLNRPRTQSIPRFRRLEKVKKRLSPALYLQDSLSTAFLVNEKVIFAYSVSSSIIFFSCWKAVEEVDCSWLSFISNCSWCLMLVQFYLAIFQFVRNYRGRVDTQLLATQKV